jgi:hypothetical protein
VTRPTRQYATPAAFKRALEDRLKAEARKTGATVHRLRQLLVFDRYLGRLNKEFGDSLLAKGGVVLELRLELARATRDLDVRISGPPEELLERLGAAGRRDLGDFLSFALRAAPEGEGTIDGPGAVYEGVRYRVEAQIAGETYGAPFGLDAAFGDALTGAVDTIAGTDLLAFVGAPRSVIRLYPRETHVAEKLHAYTLPRPRENSRVKDLPDVALLGSSGPFDAAVLRSAFKRTFAFRKTHPLPNGIPAPPESWASAYARMAEENGLRWRTLAEVLAAARSFVEPALELVSGTWSPDEWTWR